VLKYFSVSLRENSGGAENSTENSGPHAKNLFCSMYEMSQRHPVWVAENHVKPCNSVSTPRNNDKLAKPLTYLCVLGKSNKPKKIAAKLEYS
jgi:hypothetical protein